ncbi:hypothetical protein T459_31037 [Capsicum annuum]|uniref:Protein TAR1-like n=1 Tax=Capsicum annuum TaxID=4072 RepID=A0A2G2YA44_CAPAN|nr:hypothetical protein T459_31037 [Capsicum annuum]
MVPRCHGALVSWCHGALVPWCLGAMVPRCQGALVPHDALVPHGALVSWCHGAMDPWCHSAFVPWCHDTTMTSCHGARLRAMVPRCLAAQCHVILVPRCLGARCHDVIVPRYYDVPSQPNSSPDNVFHLDRPAERALELARELQLSCGKLLREPTTRRFDYSFAPTPKSDERFALQYRCGPPPEFSLVSPRSGIVHHFSGPDRYAHTRTLIIRSRSVGGAPLGDGSNGEPTSQRSELTDTKARRRRTIPATIEQMVFHERIESPNFGRPPIHAGPRPKSIGGPAHRRSTSDRGASPAFIRFPPDNFKLSLTLSSKSFSSFPRVGAPKRERVLESRRATGYTRETKRVEIQPSLATTSVDVDSHLGQPRARGAQEASIRPATTVRPVIDERCEGATRCMMPGKMWPRPNGFGRNLRSKTQWFTGFCNSHQVSYFATFFIDARAEISVVESHFCLQKKHRFNGHLATLQAVNCPRRRDPNILPDYSIASGCLGTTVLRCVVAMAPRCLSNMEPWSHGAFVPWCHGAMVPQCHRATVPCCPVPWCHGALVPRCLGATVNSPTLGEFCFTMIGRADIEGSKSNVAMNAWLPQASYPCGNFSDTSSFEFRSRIPLVRTSSELAVRRAGKAPEGTVPSPSPGRHAATRSRGRRSSSPPTADGFGTGTPVPIPQSQSFSRSYGSILPTFHAYIVPLTRGCSPWRPDAVMSTTWRGRHSVLWIFKGRR